MQSSLQIFFFFLLRSNVWLNTEGGKNKLNIGKAKESRWNDWYKVELIDREDTLTRCSKKSLSLGRERVWYIAKKQRYNVEIKVLEKLAARVKETERACSGVAGSRATERCSPTFPSRRKLNCGRKRALGKFAHAPQTASRAWI